MKKTYYLLAFALIATAPILTSCDDDDDRPNFEELTLISDFDLDFEHDFLTLCDVTVTATGFNGETRTVNIEAPDWEEKLQTTIFPASCSYKVNITRKPDVTLNKATYDLDCDLSFEADAYLGYNKTNVVPDRDVILSTAERVPAELVNEEIDRIIAKANATTFSYSFTKTDAGKIEFTETNN